MDVSYGRFCWLQFFFERTLWLFGSLHFVHEAEEVASPDEAYLLFCVAFAQESACEVDEFAGRCSSSYATVAVEVGAYAYVFYAHDVDGMVEMFYGIEDGGFCHLIAGAD